MWAPQWHWFFFEKKLPKEEDWNFDESDNESDDDYVSDQGYATG